MKKVFLFTAAIFILVLISSCTADEYNESERQQYNHELNANNDDSLIPPKKKG